MPDPDTAADTAGMPPVAMAAMPPAGDAAEAVLTPPGDDTDAERRGSAEAFRDALKARIGGVRAHLVDAAAGDHRATVSALTKLTDLVDYMLGPDRHD